MRIMKLKNPNPTQLKPLISSGEDTEAKTYLILIVQINALIWYSFEYERLGKFYSHWGQKNC